jgi:hypothetical protein
MKSLLILLLSSLAFGQTSSVQGKASISGTANVQGGSATVVSLAVTPNTAGQTQNVSQTFGMTATVTLSTGGTLDVTSSATWTSSNTGIADFVSLTATENAQCKSAGTVVFSATYGNSTGSSVWGCVGVLPPSPTPVSLALTPAAPSINAGQPVQYTATETYSDGSTLDVTASAVFTSGTPSIATIGPLTTTREVDCTSSGGGTSVISAVNDGLVPATSTLTCNAVLSTITIAPASPSIVAGTTLQFAATCNYSDGSSKACVAPTWSSNTSATATISSTGLATAIAAGTSTIKAQIGSVSGTTLLTVTSPGPPPPTLSGILVSPASKTINTGTSLPFIATGTYSDGSTANVSAQATWTTSNAAVASLQLHDAVVGKSDSWTLTGTGSTPYQWTVPALASSGQIDILDFAAMPLPTRNASHLGVPGLYKAFRLDGGILWWIKNSAGNPWDGELYDGSFFYHWFTEDGDAADQAACIAAGYSSCFLDPFAYKMFNVPVKVAPRYFTLGGADVVVKSPSPNNFVRTTNCGVDKQPLINLGNIMGITHDAGNVNWGGSVGTVRTIEIQYYWGIANETTVPPQSGTRERYELALGFGQVVWDTSHWNGSGWTVDQTSTDNVVVAGGAPTPNFGCKLPALPLSGALPPGIISTSSPQLNLRDSTGVISGTPNTAGNYPVTVQQEDGSGAFHIQPQVIRVNATAGTAQQTVNGLTAGSATITATIGAVSNGTTLTVQAPVPTLSSIGVTPANPSQYNGSTVQFTATGTYSDGSTQNLTSQVAWTSGTTTVATIGTSTGLATCIANSGSSTITATLGVSGTSTLTCQTPTTNTGGNVYCTTGGTWIGPTTDGPAALPTQCMNTALSNTPSPGTVRGPDTSTAQVQADINAAACGDVITVTAGSTIGTITLPAKGCNSTHWITIRSTGTTNGSFPAEGTRMTPCWSGIASLPGRPSYPCASPAVLTFKIVTPASSNGIKSTSADHYRIIGAELTRVSTPGASISQLVDLSSSGTQTNNVIFDRSWFEGIEGTFPSGSTATDTSTTRGIYLGQSNHIAVIDSYFTNFYDTSVTSASGQTDAQCMAGGFGSIANSNWGVYKFVNNHCEASGEGILLGGAGGPALTPNGCTILVNCNVDTPTDLEVRQNYFFKPLQWNGNTTIPGGKGWPVVKNGFEMKTGVRALFEGNVIENCWFNAQGCGAFNVAPINQQSGGSSPVATCPTCVVTDFTYRYNYSYNTANGINVYAAMPTTCSTCQSQGMNRVSIHDNLIGDNMNLGSLTGTSTGDDLEILFSNDVTGKGLNKIQNLNISHNTWVKAIRSAILFGGASGNGQLVNFTVQNNLFNYGNFGYVAVNNSSSDCETSAGANFSTALTNCSASATWTLNGLFNWNGGSVLGKNWPTNGSGLGNFFFTGTSGVGFTNYGTGNSNFTPGNYQLLTSSPLHNAGSDGKDLGADVITLQSKIAGVRQ